MREQGETYLMDAANGAQDRPRQEAHSLVDALGRTTRLRVLLLIVVFAQLLGLTYMPAERQRARVWMSSNWFQVRIWWWQRADPRPGIRINLAQHGANVPAPGPAGVIAVNNCEGCSLSAAKRFAMALHDQNVPRLYAISRHQEAQRAIKRLKLVCEKAGVQAEFLWDKTGTLHRVLNPYFLPRIYTIDSDGALSWVQRPGEDPPTVALPQKQDTHMSDRRSRP
jgi:hypothetical protein